MRIFLSASLLLTLATGVVQAQRTAPPAEQRATVYVNASYVRRTASMDAPVIATLTKGAQVSVIERVAEWALVQFGKSQGWVRASTLTFPPAPAPAPAPGAPSPRASSPTAAAPAAAAPAAATPAAATPAAATPAAATPAAAAPAASVSPTTDAGSKRRKDSAAARGISIGVLGSGTSIDATGSSKAQLHPAVLPLVMINASRLGIYAAPEIGSGAGYSSLMLGGGLGVPIVSIGRLHLMAMGGITTYQETRTAAGVTDTWDMIAASGGGLASIRLVGRVRFAYRGHYVKGLSDNADVSLIRHSFGLIF